jgi:hypothetical protein
MNQRPQFIVHRASTRSAPPSFRYSTKSDPLPRSWSESIDSRSLTFDRREDMDYASDYDHLGGFRVLVWGFSLRGSAGDRHFGALVAPTSDPLKNYVDSLESLLRAYSHRHCWARLDILTRSGPCEGGNNASEQKRNRSPKPNTTPENGFDPSVSPFCMWHPLALGAVRQLLQPGTTLKSQSLPHLRWFLSVTASRPSGAADKKAPNLRKSLTRPDANSWSQ